MLSYRKFNEILTRNARAECEFFLPIVASWILFRSLQVVQKKKKQWKEKRSKRISSFCAALQVVGHKPAKSPYKVCVENFPGEIRKPAGKTLCCPPHNNCIFKALTNTGAAECAVAHLLTLTPAPMDCSGLSGRTVPGRAFPLHAKHFWPLSRDRKSQRLAHTN